MSLKLKPTVLPAALFSLILAALPRPVHAQGDPTRLDPLNPQNTLAKRLDVLAGEWDVVIHFKVAPGRFTDGQATCVSKWILDNHILHQEYTSTLNRRPFTVLQWLGYDPGKRKFFEIKMDSMDPAVMHNEGTLSEDGKVLTQRGERSDPLTGKTQKIRTVLTFVDHDHYTLDWYLPDEQGVPEKAVSLSHTRKKR